MNPFLLRIFCLFVIFLLTGFFSFVQADTDLTTTAVISDSSEIGSNEWYITAVEVNFSATGGEYPVGNITYWLDNSDRLQISGASGTRTFYQQGQHTLYFYATDIRGAQESPVKQISFKIDTVAPSNWHNFSLTRSGNEHTYIASINVSDSTSGLDSASNALQYKTEREPSWGYYENFLSCSSSWYADGWYGPFSSFVNGINQTTLTTSAIDFCNSSWGSCEKVLKFKIRDMAGNESVSQFCINGAWFETQNGDIGSNSSINLEASGPEPTATGVLNAVETISNVNADWLVSHYSSIERPNYLSWYRQAGEGAEPLPLGKLPVQSGVYLIEGNFSITTTNIPVDYQTYQNLGAVIFVNGNLTINTNFSLHQSSGLIFIVSGNINIDRSVTSISGMYLADHEIDTSYNGNVQDTLTVYGSLMGEEIEFSRSLKDHQNQTTPSEILVYRPSYLVNADLVKILAGTVKYSWQEVSP